MTKDDCFELGIISKLFSFKGEVILYIDSDQPDHYYDVEMVFLEINKQLVPYFVEKSAVHNKANQMRVRFDTIDDEDGAKRIVKKKVYLPLTELPQLKDDQFYYHEVKGYMMQDQDGKDVGKILDVIVNPANTLAEVSYKFSEALIPLNDNSFISIDKVNKTIKVAIPEGLLDIYG
jgi:16S rRNA processing protein RimM